MSKFEPGTSAVRCRTAGDSSETFLNTKRQKTGLSVGWMVRQTELPRSSQDAPRLVLTVLQILAHYGINAEFGAL